jgi:hypothetical protein
MRQIFVMILIVAALATGCAPQGLVPSSDIAKTGISGQVTGRTGHGVADAWVYAYRNTSSSLRGPADFGARTDSQGDYFLDMVEGSYYLIARWRQDGGEAGPPRAGDAWAMLEKNPIQVEAGKVSRADFRLQGVQAGQPVLLRSGSLTQGKTGFTGRLVDQQGEPLPGAFALAYSDPDFRRMPDFTSAVVGSDGRFQLYLPAGAKYCLAARTRTRGQPVAGEPYGLLDVGEAGCRDTVENKLIDVGIIRLSPYQR